MLPQFLVVNFCKLFGILAEFRGPTTAVRGPAADLLSEAQRRPTTFGLPIRTGLQKQCLRWPTCTAGALRPKVPKVSSPKIKKFVGSKSVKKLKVNEIR